MDIRTKKIEELVTDYPFVVSYFNDNNLDIGNYEGLVKIVFDNEYTETISVSMKVCDDDVNLIESKLKDKLLFAQQAPYPGPEAERYFGFTIDNNLFVLNSSDSRVFIFNTTNNTWSETDALPTSTSNSKNEGNAVSLNNMGYVLLNNKLHIFNHNNTQKWEVIKLETNEVALVSLVVNNNNLFTYHEYRRLFCN